MNLLGSLACPVSISESRARLCPLAPRGGCFLCASSAAFQRFFRRIVKNVNALTVLSTFEQELGGLVIVDSC